MSAAALPPQLTDRPQWVVWRYKIVKGRRTKPPHRASAPDRKASSTDPTTWAEFDVAAQTAAAEGIDGMGFVVTADDPICGVDLDDCFDADGNVHEAAWELVARLDSYTEISPSGRGLRVFLLADKPSKRSTRPMPWRGKVEVYDRERYFTVTGDHLVGTPNTIEHRQAELNALWSELFPPRPAGAAPPSRPLVVPEDDRELVELAMRARNGTKFAAVWRGDTSGHGGDDSSADLALCNHLRFWTGGDPERMDRLFRESGLMRPKWDERHGDRTYGVRTIDKALSGTTHTTLEDNAMLNPETFATFNGDRKSGPVLASQVPAQASANHAGYSSTLAREVTDQLDLASDPVVEVKRWGRHEDSRLVVTLRSKRRVVFERARDAFEPAVLKRRVVLATDGQASPPTLSKPKAEDVAVKLIRMANVAADHDDRAEASDWADRFLALHQPATPEVADFSTPPGRYEVVSMVQARRAPVVLDASTGARIVSVSEMARFVRAEAGGPISWQTLHSRLAEVGWKHLGEVHQRQPKGSGRRKAHLYLAPPEEADE